MKINHYSWFFLITAVLFLGAYAPCRAATANERSHHTLVVTSDFKSGPARLIIKRIPNLGKFLTVSLLIDGNPVSGIPYGGTFEGFLSPGRHTVSALGVPFPAWPPPLPMTLDVRSGRTYVFTAMGDHMGHVVLVSRPE